MYVLDLVDAGLFVYELIMGDKFGQLKVTVVKGRSLAIRDFNSSDPYVILKLGKQVVPDVSYIFLCSLTCKTSFTTYHSELNLSTNLFSPCQNKQ